MIYAIRRVKLGRLFQSILPPLVTALCQSIPVIDRQIPILPTVGEHVRRGARPETGNKCIPMCPDIRAVLTHENWQVTLQHDTGIRSLAGNSAELLLQSHLQPDVKEKIPRKVAVRPDGIDVVRGRVPILRPLLPRSFLIARLEDLEGRIVTDPRIVGGEAIQIGDGGLIHDDQREELSRYDELGGRQFPVTDARVARVCAAEFRDRIENRFPIRGGE